MFDSMAFTIRKNHRQDCDDYPGFERETNIGPRYLTENDKTVHVVPRELLIEFD